jgi:hypothetical protein
MTFNDVCLALSLCFFLSCNSRNSRFFLIIDFFAVFFAVQHEHVISAIRTLCNHESRSTEARLSNESAFSMKEWSQNLNSSNYYQATQPFCEAYSHKCKKL